MFVTIMICYKSHQIGMPPLYTWVGCIRLCRNHESQGNCVGMFPVRSVRDSFCQYPRSRNDVGVHDRARFCALLGSESHFLRTLQGGRTGTVLPDSHSACPGILVNVASSTRGIPSLHTGPLKDILRCKI